MTIVDPKCIFAIKFIYVEHIHYEKIGGSAATNNISSCNSSPIILTTIDSECKSHKLIMFIVDNENIAMYNSIFFCFFENNQPLVLK